MNTKFILWRSFTAFASFLVIACGKDANDLVMDQPELDQQQAVGQAIPYTVTIIGKEGDDVPARATVDADNKTLRFAAGDQLYISGTDIQGVLDIESGVGETSGAVFSGDLIYSGSGDPADDLELTATLVGADNVGVTIDGGVVTGITYPSSAFCTDVYEAVQQYSLLTGTSPFAARSFMLSQQTAFLDFSVALHDGTVSGAAFDVTVANGGADIATVSVTTENVGGTATARFVLPVAAGTVLSGATVTVGTNPALSFGGTSDKTLDAKVYHIRRDITASVALKATNPTHIGWRLCSDGRAYYPTGTLPAGVSALAMICSSDGWGYGYALEINSSPEMEMEYWPDAVKIVEERPAMEGTQWEFPTLELWCELIACCAGESMGLDPEIYLPSSAACDVFIDMYRTAGGNPRWFEIAYFWGGECSEELREWAFIFMIDYHYGLSIDVDKFYSSHCFLGVLKFYY